MKLSILILFIVFFSMSAFTQEKYTSYTMIDHKLEFDIDVSFGQDYFILYIYAYSVESISDRGGFAVYQSNLNGFLQNLKDAKAKYIEWREVAERNNVRDFRKDIKIKPEKITGYFVKDNKANVDFSVEPVYFFSVLEAKEKAEYVLYVGTGQLVSSSNENITHEGFTLIFKSVDEIDFFIELLDENKILVFKNKPKIEDLFKD